MLYLIRHADAAPGEMDAERPLTAKGLDQVLRMSRFLKTAGIEPPREIWHSPLVRARQTAAGLAGHLGWQSPLNEVDGLTPESPPEIAARRLGKCRHSVAIVGHNPHLEFLAALLVTGSVDPQAFVMAKGCVLALEPVNGGGPGGWAAVWQIAPGLLV